MKKLADGVLVAAAGILVANAADLLTFASAHPRYHKAAVVALALAAWLLNSPLAKEKAS